MHPALPLTAVFCTTLLATAAIHAANTPQPLIQFSLGGLSLADQQAEWDEVSEDQPDVEFPSSLPGDGTPAITDSDGADFAAGLYSRAGIDFDIGKERFLGLGVRYLAAEMEFDKTIGVLDLEGPQLVLAYTAYL